MANAWTRRIHPSATKRGIVLRMFHVEHFATKNTAPEIPPENEKSPRGKPPGQVPMRVERAAKSKDQAHNTRIAELDGHFKRQISLD